MKNYTVWYWIKANCQETLHTMEVEATNGKDACKKCKELVKQQTGHNAFRPGTKNPLEK